MNTLLRKYRALDLAAQLGPAMVAGLLIFALLGPLAAVHQPDAIDLARRLQAPSAAHWFGTDELGRDLFSRIAYGARISLAVAIATVSTTMTIATFIGVMAALSGKWLHGLVMRLTDVALSIPALVLAIALSAALGPSLINALIALVIVRLPVFIRLARAQALALRERSFVEAAEMVGAGRFYIFRHHILPNISGVMLVQGLMDMAAVILATAALGFLGLGAQPPTPEWGALVASGRHYVLDAWWYAVFPGAALLLSAVAFNLSGDAVRDLLDPRLREST